MCTRGGFLFYTFKSQTVWVSGCVCNEATENGEAGRCHGNRHGVCGALGFGVAPAAGGRNKQYEMKWAQSVTNTTMFLWSIKD